MSEKFSLEILSPESLIIKTDVKRNIDMENRMFADVTLWMYSQHAIQEHRWFSQGSSVSVVINVILSVTILLLLGNRSNPGARSSTYVLLDAF